MKVIKKLPEMRQDTMELVSKAGAENRRPMWLSTLAQKGMHRCSGREECLLRHQLLQIDIPACY